MTTPTPTERATLAELIHEFVEATKVSENSLEILRTHGERQRRTATAAHALQARLDQMRIAFERIEVHDLLLDQPMLDGTDHGAQPPDGDAYNDVMNLMQAAFADIAPFDNTQAVSEGWAIFESAGSADGRWQLQADAETGLLPDDAVAWRLVVHKARARSDYHLRALAWLRRHNLAEFDRILKFVKEEPHAPAHT